MRALPLDLGTARTRLLLSGSTAIKERPSAFGGGVDIADPRPRILLDAGAGIAEAVVIRAGEIADPGATVSPAPDPGNATVRGPACPLPTVEHRTSGTSATDECHRTKGRRR